MPYKGWRKKRVQKWASCFHLFSDGCPHGEHIRKLKLSVFVQPLLKYYLETSPQLRCLDLCQSLDIPKKSPCWNFKALQVGQPISQQVIDLSPALSWQSVSLLAWPGGGLAGSEAVVERPHTARARTARPRTARPHTARLSQPGCQ